MGALSQVPFLAGYNEQDQINRSRESQGLQTLGQMMTLQNQQQQLMNAPEDRLLRNRLINSQIGEQEALSSKNRADAEKRQAAQAIITQLSALPQDHPDRPALMFKARMLLDPTQALDPDKAAPSMFGKVNPNDYTPASIAKFAQTKNYGDLVAAAKPSTHINMPPAVTPVTIQDPNNPNATIIIDGRTKQVLGAGPKMTETGKANYKQAQTMQGLGSDLQRAEDLLMGNVRDSEGNVTKGNLPTGSGIGSLYDAAAGFVGSSPTGAAEADALKTVAGRLVQKVPRFEGPQSDKDVVLYKQMAADAGNDKIPRERRLMAVQKMREIYSGYEDGSKGRILQEQFATGGQSSGGKIGVPGVRNQSSAVDAALEKYK